MVSVRVVDLFLDSGPFVETGRRGRGPCRGNPVSESVLPYTVSVLSVEFGVLYKKRVAVDRPQ